jgi:hypothetical protein
MKFSCRLLLMLLLFAAGNSADAVEPALQPQHAVLVLRNRQVIEGNITPAGDYYLVSFGKTGQVRLAAKEVEMVCRSLDEAYQRKAADIAGKSASAHLELADWCLKQSLYDYAHAEIRRARELEPAHRRIVELETRLEFATTKPKPVVRPVTTTATVSAEQLERTMKEQPPGTVEHFTAVVQPILMDRCGAARCHGGNTATSFELLQPTAGKIPSRRFTQRNLFAALSAVDKELPDQSRLLEMALKPHGFTKAAPFKSDDDRQYREIAEWVHSLRIVPKQAAPATVNTAQMGTPRPQMGVPEPKASTGEITVPTPSEPASETSSSTLARDPFDPAIFNRRFHGSP